MPKLTCDVIRAKMLERNDDAELRSSGFPAGADALSMLERRLLLEVSSVTTVRSPFSSFEPVPCPCSTKPPSMLARGCVVWLERPPTSTPTRQRPGAPSAREPHGPSALERLRRQMFEDARKAHPPFHVGFDAFCSHLDHVGHREGLQLDGRALYLCVACGFGNPAAFRVLETEYIGKLRADLARFHGGRDFVDDVLQLVRDRLLVGSKPRILSYRGSGGFRSWLRRIASNIALDSLRTGQHLDEAGCAELCAGFSGEEQTSPEDLAVHRQLAYFVGNALSRAILTLDVQDRNLLSLHFVSGLSVDVLGRMCAVNRSTAARRIARHVGQLQREVKREVAATFGTVGRGELSQMGVVLANCMPLDAGLLLTYVEHHALPRGTSVLVGALSDAAEERQEGVERSRAMP